MIIKCGIIFPNIILNPTTDDATGNLRIISYFHGIVRSAFVAVTANYVSNENSVCGSNRAVRSCSI